MFINVSYHDHATGTFKTEHSYTYETEREDIGVGMIVSAPVKNRRTKEVEEKRALVISIGVPAPNFPCNKVEFLWDEVHPGE